MPWYTIQTRSAFENKVMNEIPQKLEAAGLSGDLMEVFAPEEPVVTYKDGVRKETKKKKYPNYIFVNINYSENLWYALKGINGFSGFLGNKNRPEEISAKEIEKMKQEVQTAVPRPKVEFAIDSKVLIKEGPFKDFNATVAYVDYETGKIKVNVTIFGRETLVEMSVPDVEAVS